MPEKLTVILFSNQKQTVEIIAQTLQGSGFYLGGITDSFENTRTLLSQYAPEFLIINLDTNCRETNTLVNRLKSVSPRTKIIVTGNHCDNEILFNAVKAGADVFLSDSMDPSDLLDILQTLMEDGVYLPAYIAESLLEKSQKENQSPTEFPLILTAREQSILSEFSTGANLVSVAGNLGIPPELVKAHTTNILQKIHFVYIAQKQYEEIMSGLSNFRSSFEY